MCDIFYIFGINTDEMIDFLSDRGSTLILDNVCVDDKTVMYSDMFRE